MRAPAWRRPTPTPTTPRTGTPSIAGRSRGATGAWARRRSISPSEVRAYASTFDEEGDWRYEESYGQVWYPRVAVGWRPYYYGRWAQYPRVRLDLDRRGSFWLANASLRTLGLQVQRVVLDSGALLGARARVVGLRAGICELVSARVQQPAGHRGQYLQRRSGLLLVVPRVDDDRLLALRPFLRAPPGGGLGSVRSHPAAGVPGRPIGAGVSGRRRFAPFDHGSGRPEQRRGAERCADQVGGVEKRSV